MALEVEALTDVEHTSLDVRGEGAIACFSSGLERKARM